MDGTPPIKIKRSAEVLFHALTADLADHDSCPAEHSRLPCHRIEEISGEKELPTSPIRKLFMASYCEHYKNHPFAEGLPGDYRS
jgi:hypothetical protein